MFKLLPSLIQLFLKNEKKCKRMEESLDDSWEDVSFDSEYSEEEEEEYIGVLSHEEMLKPFGLGPDATNAEILDEFILLMKQFMSPAKMDQAEDILSICCLYSSLVVNEEVTELEWSKHRTLFSQVKKFLCSAFKLNYDRMRYARVSLSSLVCRIFFVYPLLMWEKIFSNLSCGQRMKIEEYALDYLFRLKRGQRTPEAQSTSEEEAADLFSVSPAPMKRLAMFQMFSLQAGCSNEDIFQKFIEFTDSVPDNPSGECSKAFLILPKCFIYSSLIKCDEKVFARELNSQSMMDVKELLCREFCIPKDVVLSQSFRDFMISLYYILPAESPQLVSWFINEDLRFEIEKQWRLVPRPLLLILATLRNGRERNLKVQDCKESAGHPEKTVKAKKNIEKEAKEAKSLLQTDEIASSSEAKLNAWKRKQGKKSHSLVTGVALASETKEVTGDNGKKNISNLFENVAAPMTREELLWEWSLPPTASDMAIYRVFTGAVCYGLMKGSKGLLIPYNYDGAVAMLSSVIRYASLISYDKDILALEKESLTIRTHNLILKEFFEMNPNFFKHLKDYIINLFASTLAGSSEFCTDVKEVLGKFIGADLRKSIQEAYEEGLVVQEHLQDASNLRNGGTEVRMKIEDMECQENKTAGIKDPIEKPLLQPNGIAPASEAKVGSDEKTFGKEDVLSNLFENVAAPLGRKELLRQWNLTPTAPNIAIFYKFNAMVEDRLATIRQRSPYFVAPPVAVTMLFPVIIYSSIITYDEDILALESKSKTVGSVKSIFKEYYFQMDPDAFNHLKDYIINLFALEDSSLINIKEVMSIFMGEDLRRNIQEAYENEMKNKQKNELKKTPEMTGAENQKKAAKRGRQKLEKKVQELERGKLKEPVKEQGSVSNDGNTEGRKEIEDMMSAEDNAHGKEDVLSNLFENVAAPLAQKELLRQWNLTPRASNVAIFSKFNATIEDGLVRLKSQGPLSPPVAVTMLFPVVIYGSIISYDKHILALESKSKAVGSVKSIFKDYFQIDPNMFNHLKDYIINLFAIEGSSMDYICEIMGKFIGANLRRNIQEAYEKDMKNRQKNETKKTPEMTRAEKQKRAAQKRRQKLEKKVQELERGKLKEPVKEQGSVSNDKNITKQEKHVEKKMTTPTSQVPMNMPWELIVPKLPTEPVRVKKIKKKVKPSAESRVHCRLKTDVNPKPDTPLKEATIPETTKLPYLPEESKSTPSIQEANPVKPKQPKTSKREGFTGNQEDKSQIAPYVLHKKGSEEVVDSSGNGTFHSVAVWEKSHHAIRSRTRAAAAEEKLAQLTEQISLINIKRSVMCAARMSNCSSAMASDDFDDYVFQSDDEDVVRSEAAGNDKKWKPGSLMESDVENMARCAFMKKDEQPIPCTRKADQSVQPAMLDDDLLKPCISSDHDENCNVLKLNGAYGGY